MIFTEKTRKEILGTLVLILGVASVIVFFVLESPLDLEIYRILMALLLMFLITLAGFEVIVLLIHSRDNQQNGKFNPPV